MSTIRLTRRGEILARLAETAIVTIALAVLLGAAVAFGLAHPGRTDWALVPLGALLIVLALAWAVRRVPQEPAEHSVLEQSEIAYAERLASRHHR